MAVNLEAIRKRVQELSGQRKNSNVQLWKPEPGEYRVRGLPWPSDKLTDEGTPFIERRFYYIGDNPRILAPAQFKKPDPINDLIRKLYSSGKAEDRTLAKKLQPKMTAYMPLVVRGQEDKGVLVWSFNKFTYQRLLGFFTDAEVGDILDPQEGFDLKVTIKPSGKKFNGKEVMDIVIDAARKSTPLANDTETAQKWLASVPNIDDMYPQKSASEIETTLNNWLSGGGASDAESDGEQRGDKPQDVLDQIVEDVKAEVKSSSPKAEVKKPRPQGKKNADVDVETSGKKTSLDEAFDELTRDE